MSSRRIPQGRFSPAGREGENPERGEMSMEQGFSLGKRARGAKHGGNGGRRPGGGMEGEFVGGGARSANTLRTLFRRPREGTKGGRLREAPSRQPVLLPEQSCAGCDGPPQYSPRRGPCRLSFASHEHSIHGRATPLSEGGVSCRPLCALHSWNSRGGSTIIPEEPFFWLGRGGEVWENNITRTMEAV